MSRKLISIILVVALILTSVPVNSLAAAPQSETFTETSDITNETDTATAPEIVESLTDPYVPTDNEAYTEIINKRDEYTKYFLLDSKRYEAVMYGVPVHYLEDGEFKDIDNSLSLASDKKGKSYYKNKANSFNAMFSSSLDGGWNASISKDGYEMKWMLEGTLKGTSGKKSTYLSDSKWTTLKKGDQRRNLPDIASQIEFDNAKNGVDLEYQLISNKIKENIILNKFNGINTFQQRISLKGLDLIKNDDGSIVAVDSKDNSKEVFYIPAPFAIDSKSNETFDIKVALEHVTDMPIDEPVEEVPTETPTPTETPAPTESPVETETPVPSDTPAPSEIPEPSESPEATVTPASSTEEDLQLAGEEPAANTEETVKPELTEAPEETKSDASDTPALFDEATNTYILTYTLDSKWLKSASYPVILDPTVTTSLNTADILDTRVCQGLPTTNYKDSYIMCTGYGSSSQNNYSLVQFNNMPTIGASYMVVYAGYRVKKATSSTVTSYVSAHEITSSWNVNTVTWNTKPSFNSRVEDFKQVGLNAGDTYEWDITRIAKKWYSGGSRNGLLLKDMDDTNNYKEWYTANAEYGNVPYCYFVYTNFTGFEGYWDYTSSSLGRSGTASVNLYNGNLVYSHNDVSESGNRMPVTVSHIFNSTTKDSDESSMYYGNGWRTNYDQRISSVNIGGVDYRKYIDEDGTEHYFTLRDGAWKDESGLDVTLLFNSGIPRITDKNGNSIFFYPTTDANKPGFLNYIVDRNGNRQTVGYDANNRISQITDGAGRIIRFTRDASNHLAKIREEVSSGLYRDTTFTYSSSRLTRITYPDGKYTSFTYDTNGNIDYVTGIDSKKIDLSYLSSSPYRVTYIGESTPTELGDELSFSYGYNRTTMTDSQGRKTTYQFNDNGNTVCVIGPDGSASYTKYGTTATGGDMNKITDASKLQKFGKSYIKNGGMEFDSDWYFESHSGSTGTHTYSTGQKYLGDQSVYLQKTNSTSYECARQTLTLEKGKTYTLSGYIKTENVSQSTMGALIQATYYDSQGGSIGARTTLLSGTNNWARYSTTFTVPADSSTTTVYIFCLVWNSTGKAWFDGLQLEEGCIANRYNIIDNADFDYVTSGLPDKWTGDNCGSGDIIVTTSDTTNPPYMSDNRMLLNAIPDSGKAIQQVLNLSGNEGDTYVVGGWAKCNSIPITGSVKCGISINIKYSDSQYGDEWFVVPFSQDSDSWQYVSAPIVAKHAYSGIRLKCEIIYNANTVEFDGIQMFKEEYGSSFTYDAKGNLTKVTDAAKQNEQFQYDANNDLKKYIDPSGKEFNYTYDSKHNMLTATSAEGLVYTYTYDSYGNATSAKVGNTTDYIKAAVNYDSNGNYTDYSTDPFGNQINYTYNTFKGTLESVTDPLNNTINNTYDSNTDALKGASMASGGITVSNSYTYTNDRLTQASHNAPGGTVDYNISYNTLGWNTGTSVGSQALVTNTLKARTGRLDRVTYGNGQFLNYYYDAYDRLVRIAQDTTTLYVYQYDNSGNVGYMKDYVQGVEYWYEYDSLNRLGKTIKKDASGTSTSQYTFNSQNAVSAFKEAVGGTTYQTSYTYDDDSRPDTATFGTYSKGITYNTTLGTATGFALKNNGTAFYNTSIAYDNGDGSTSTKSGRVDSITNGGETLSYTYDARSYITKVQKDADNYSEYRYDAFGQLVRENYKWGATSHTKIFTYDVGGNITHYYRYAFAEGDSDHGTQLGSQTWTYDSTWKDKLIGYNGKSITYDNIGNPLNDGIWTYTWTQGRRLQQITDGTTTASYKYNDSGIRTEKTVNGTATKFNLVGDNITWQKTGTSDPIYFIYDSGDKLWALKYTDGNTYFYVRNAQGDIIKIVDTSGNVVVEYAYDAWGKPMGVTGSMAATLGVDNPFRYRGYYYDTETGLYYLNQRYYNPEWGRFVNADNVIGVTGKLLSHNMFAYCNNNPVMMSDPSGNLGFGDFRMAERVVEKRNKINKNKEKIEDALIKKYPNYKRGSAQINYINTYSRSARDAKLINKASDFIVDTAVMIAFDKVSAAMKLFSVGKHVTDAAKSASQWARYGADAGVGLLADTLLESANVWRAKSGTYSNYEYFVPYGNNNVVGWGGMASLNEKSNEVEFLENY